MSPALLFAFGVLVFLITVYGTVVVGGLLLTDRQLSDDPTLSTESPDDSASPPTSPSDDRTARRRLVPAEY